MKKIILLSIFLLSQLILGDTQLNALSPAEINSAIASQQGNGELPFPMIVGGEQVSPPCPNCKYEFMVSLQSSGWGVCKRTQDPSYLCGDLWASD